MHLHIVQPSVIMPPRPAGTDGRDHSYREVIAERYKRMAEYKDKIEKLMFSHIAFLFLKLAWHVAADTVGNVGLPRAVLGMVAGEGAMLLVYNMAKLGTVKESLRTLKLFNVVQALITATQVLDGWQYHQGVNNGGIASHKYPLAIASYLGFKYPSYDEKMVAQYLMTFELFLDLTLGIFLIMSTFISHKMIVEKMEMKKEKENVQTDRKDAQKGGSDDDVDEDDDDAAPDAVPIKNEEETKVVKAAATSKTAAARRRHA